MTTINAVHNVIKIIRWFYQEICYSTSNLHTRNQEHMLTFFLLSLGWHFCIFVSKFAFTIDSPIILSSDQWTRWELQSTHLEQYLLYTLKKKIYKYSAGFGKIDFIQPSSLYLFFLFLPLHSFLFFLPLLTSFVFHMSSSFTFLSKSCVSSSLLLSRSSSPFIPFALTYLNSVIPL